MLLSPLTFDSNNIQDANTVSWFMLAGRYPLSVSLQTQSRRNTHPMVDALSVDGRTIQLNVRRADGASKSVPNWNADTKKWFDPSAGRDGVRYLTLTGDDGSTTLRLGCYVQSIEPRPGFSNWYVVNLIAENPYFEANSLTTSASNPATVTNAGNVAVAPTIELTHATHVTRRPCTVASPGAGGGLLRRIVRFDLNDAAATATNVFVFVEGVSVPCFVVNGGSSTSRVYALLDTHSDGTSTTAVDVVYGTGLTNPLAGALSSQGWRTSTGAILSNATWAWEGWSVSSYTPLPGVWTPRQMAMPVSSSYGISSESASSVQFSLAETTFDANAIGVLLAGFSTGSLTQLSRVTASMSNARAYVRARLGGTLNWVDLWTQTGNATVTTTISATSRVELVAGIEATGATPTGTLTLSSSGSPAITSIGVTTGSAADVVVGAAQNMDRYDGTITIGNYVITLTDVVVRDGTLTIDCGASTIRSSVANSPIYGSVSFSDPSVWSLVAPGVVSTSHTTGGAMVIKFRGGFS